MAAGGGDMDHLCGGCELNGRWSCDVDVRWSRPPVCCLGCPFYPHCFHCFSGISCAVSTSLSGDLHIWDLLHLHYSKSLQRLRPPLVCSTHIPSLALSKQIRCVCVVDVTQLLIVVQLRWSLLYTRPLAPPPSLLLFILLPPSPQQLKALKGV